MVKVSRRRWLGSAAALGAGVLLPGQVLSQLRLQPEPGMARLSSNENPYGPSPRALEAAARAAERGAYYPGPIRQDLISMIAARNELTAEHVVISSGSNEGLCAAMAAYGAQGRILAPALTYSPHLGYAERTGVQVERVALAEDMSIDLAAMKARALEGDVSLVYLCNPNNPTGMITDGDTLRAFCRELGPDVVVLVDEAYNELTLRPEYSTMVDLVRAGENVIVMRTFSKIYALAGLRVGYTLAPPPLAELVGRYVMAWPNVVGMAAAIASYEDEKFVEFSRAQIEIGREMIAGVFEAHDVPYLASEANFVYADIGRDATAFAEALRQRGVLIRRAYAPFDTYSRVSTGKLADLEKFARVFREVYAGAA